MICPNCQAIIGDDSNFCTNCGTKVSPLIQPAEETVVLNAQAPMPEAVPEAAPTSAAPVMQDPASVPQAPPYSEQAYQPLPSQSQPFPNQSYQNQTYQTLPYQPQGFPPVGPAPKKSGKAWLWILLGVLALALIAGGILLILQGTRTTRVSLNPYLSCEFSGTNGYGTAYFEFDTDQLERDYPNLKVNKKHASEFEEGASAAHLLYEYCIDGTPSKNSELSNGDEITLVWELDHEIAKEYFNVVFDYMDVHYTVEGLTELAAFDPFEGLEIEYYGISPNISVYVYTSNVDPASYYYNYEVTPAEGLKNGDTFTITLEDWDGSDPTNAIAEESGKVPTALSKTYTVSGFAEAVTSQDMLDQALVSEWQQNGRQFFADYDEPYLSSDVKVKSVDYVGDMFFVLKEGFSEYSQNNVYLMAYQVTVEEPDHEAIEAAQKAAQEAATSQAQNSGDSSATGDSSASSDPSQSSSAAQEPVDPSTLVKEYSYYWYFFYDSFLIDENGTLTWDEEPGTPYDSFENANGYSYYGYETTDALKASLLTEDVLASYDVVDNIK